MLLKVREDTLERLLISEEGSRQLCRAIEQKGKKKPIEYYVKENNGNVLVNCFDYPPHARHFAS